MASFRPADPLGIQRVTLPAGRGFLPLQAEALDASLPIAEDELLIEVESLNVDSSSFRQISEACGGDVAQIEKHIIELVSRNGKLHNPITGSGGMLVGRVTQIGPAYPLDLKPVKIGDRVATLVSLTLTPLTIRSVRKVHPQKERIDIEGQAILFASGSFALIPQDMSETVALAVLDAAGVPSQIRALVKDDQTVLVLGAGGKSGLLCMYEAKQKSGIKLIAVDSEPSAMERLSQLHWVDDLIQVDARDGISVMEKVWEVTKGKMADVVIDATNIAGTEMAGILSCRPKGTVLFFNLATDFALASMGAAGISADIELRIGNGYSADQAEDTFHVFHSSDELERIFTERYS